MINCLLEKLRASVKDLEGDESGDGTWQHYENTLAHTTRSLSPVSRCIAIDQ